MDILPWSELASRIMAGWVTDQPDPKVAAISPPLYRTCSSGPPTRPGSTRTAVKTGSGYVGSSHSRPGPQEPKGKPMKFLLTATIAAALLGVSLGTSLAADPMGTWHTEEGKAIVRIAACGPALCGTIISLKEANDETGKPKTDKNNADASLRSR